MTEKEYNGWTNYETWNVALWLDNEEGSYNYWRERAEELVKECAERPSANARLTGHEPFTTKEKATLALADELKDRHEEENPVGNDASVWSDLMSAALSEVNWHEIAEHYVNEVEIEEENETEEAED